MVVQERWVKYQPCLQALYPVVLSRASSKIFLVISIALDFSRHRELTTGPLAILRRLDSCA